MSNYNTDLQTNNTSLEEILETINNLPEAGGSGGTPKIAAYVYDKSYVGSICFLEGWTWQNYIGSMFNNYLDANGYCFTNFSAPNNDLCVWDELGNKIYYDTQATIPIKSTDLIEENKVYTGVWDPDF